MKMLRNSTASVTEDAFTMPHGDTSKIGHAAPHDSLLDRLTRSSGTRELRDEDWASCDGRPMQRMGVEYGHWVRRPEALEGRGNGRD